MYFKETPLYPFGYGLSYTTFKYSNLDISNTFMNKDGSVNITFDVLNTEARTGDEVVQLYVSQENSQTTRPIKELKAFKRITLAPNQSQTIFTTLKASDVSIWNPTANRFVVENGKMLILAGSSSSDIRLNGSLSVVSDDPIPAPDPKTYIAIRRNNQESSSVARLIKDGPTLSVAIHLDEQGDVDLRIYDLRGVCFGRVYRKALPIGDTNIELNGISLASSMYIVSGKIGNNLYSSKNVIF